MTTPEARAVDHGDPTAMIRTNGGHEWTRPQSLDEAMRLADLMAKSNLVPKDLRGKPGDIMVAMQMGAELGLAPMQALQGIAVINGRPSIYGDAALALVRGHRDFLDIDETLDLDDPTYGMVASCTVIRRDQSPTTVTFSKADAERAGLWGKAGPWKQYPKRMLTYRARAFALRDAFADVLKGVGLAEEAQDIPPQTRPPGKAGTVTLPPPSGEGSAGDQLAEQLEGPPPATKEELDRALVELAGHLGGSYTDAAVAADINLDCDTPEGIALNLAVVREKLEAM